MEKFMKIPAYIPMIGIALSFALFVIAANIPNMTLVITGAVLFHLFGWMLIARYFLCVFGFFGTVLDSK
jgi:hypothetical protein